MEKFIEWVRKTSETVLGKELTTLVGQILREAVALAVIELIAILSFRLSESLAGTLGAGKDELHHFIVLANEALIVLGLVALVSRAIFHYFNYIRGKS